MILTFAARWDLSSSFSFALSVSFAFLLDLDRRVREMAFSLRVSEIMQKNKPHNLQ